MMENKQVFEMSCEVTDIIWPVNEYAPSVYGYQCWPQNNMFASLYFENYKESKVLTGQIFT